jgi:Ca2+-binding RTX toxin-like protein
MGMDKGTPGNDTLTGTPFDDHLFGLAGTDTLRGGGGNDPVLVESELAVVNGALAAVELATLDGTNGFTLIGADAVDHSGFSVSSAGDVNGDGFADLIVAAPNAGPYGEGESYVVFGKASWAGTPSLDLATLDGTNGFRLIGIDAGDRSGRSVSSAGDVNGDGFADLIVGAPYAESAGGASYEGESYVVFGKANWAGTPSLDLAALDGTNGFRLIGIDADDQSGFSVSSAGDVNGDGFVDLIVGAPSAYSAGGAYREGESYVVFGKASWAGAPSLDLATLDGTNGFRLIGIDPYDRSGLSVSSAGDVNGDGFADLIIGASPAESYVVFGKANWAGVPSLDLATLDGIDGFRLIGISTHSVSSAGDVNGDGFADVIVGTPQGGADGAGESYVVFGKASWDGTPALDLATLDGINGFRLTGIDADDLSGFSVSSAGDVNGDGFSDVIVGAPYDESAEGANYEGESYVVYGKASWAGTPSLDLATLDGTNGFRLIGIDAFDSSGRSVSSAGDVNGDGFADLIVGAHLAESAGGAYNEGESYVIFGGNFTGAVTHLGTPGDDTLTGSAAAETFVGGTGNDLLIGNGGADAFQGGAGDDVVQISTLDFHVADGGSGSDTLELDGAGLHLDLTTLADSRTRSIERIDIGGTGNNTLTLGVLDVRNFSEESNELLVLGDAGDVVNRDAGWTTAATGGNNGDGTSTIDGQIYQIYNAGQATLLIDTDITVNMASDKGSPGNDTLTGTPFEDHLFGLAGNDTLRGLAGDDTLDGGPGNDALEGGGGDDTLKGQTGKDTLLGGTGNDHLIGGSGNDDLIGDHGNDRLCGNAGRDRMSGGIGNDTLNGGVGNDSLSGGDGNDTLVGGDSADKVEGGAGNDSLSGGDGNDTLIGGADADTFVGGAGNDLLVVGSALVASVNGGKGVDIVNLDALGVSIDLAGPLGDKFANIEKLDLGGKTANTLVLDAQAVLDMAGGGGALPDDTLLVKGDRGDAVTLQGDWTKGASISNPFSETGSFDVYTSGAAKVLVESELAVVSGALAAIDLATLDGTNGFSLIGIDENDSSGFSVSSAGDVNGDGFDDVIIGAIHADGAGNDAENTGETYVVFGKASWAGTPSLGLATLDGTNGFRLIGVDENDFSGVSVSAAGDVNGDGFADVIIGAPNAKSAAGAYEEGESYVVFGKASWAGTPSIDLATLNGTNGFRLIGVGEIDFSGISVSSAGDVNGDGFDDFIIGAHEAIDNEPLGGSGGSYVVFGKASWTGTPSLDLATLDGTNGFRLEGIDGVYRTGLSVSSAGDVNGDGFADLIVGADDLPYGIGESYVVFGKANWAGTPSLDLATLDGTNGFRLAGVDVLDYAGRSVSSAGDVNGDGFADLIVGAPAGSPYSDRPGESYVVFGKANWVGTPSLDLATLDGTNGFTLTSTDSRIGHSVSSAGDVNGDGLGDLIVGADGESYVVYGKESWAGTPLLDLATLDGTNGFRLIGAGFKVSDAGDVNGDGFADLIVGFGAGPENEGESYVVFGGNFNGAVTHLGTPGDDELAGTAVAETFVGGTGNDTLNGNGGADAFQGGAGDDVVRVSTVDFHVADGGNGSDTLELDGAGLHLDLTALADSRTRSIERIDIGGTGSNTLSLGVLDVLNLSDESNELLVLGEAGDVVNRGAGWTTAATGGSNGNGTSTIDGQTYQIYTAGQATLLIDTDMTATT